MNKTNDLTSLADFPDMVAPGLPAGSSFWLCVPVTLPGGLKHARRMVHLPRDPQKGDTIWIGKTLEFIVDHIEFLIDVDETVEMELHTKIQSVKWMSDHREFLLEWNFDLSEVV